jgi:hypothetical protein
VGKVDFLDDYAIALWNVDLSAILCSALGKQVPAFSQSTLPISLSTEATPVHYCDLVELSPRTPIPPKTIKKLFGFKSLQHGWDGYGALAINEAIILRAFDMVDSSYELANRKSLSEFRLWVVPTASGGVQIEMRLGRKAIEIEINPSKITFLKIDDRFVDLSQKYEEGEIATLSYEFIHGLLNWIEK